MAVSEKTPAPTIDPSRIYPLPAAQEFFGGREGWLSARRQGLAKHIYYIGKRGFVDGADLAQFIREAGKRRFCSNAN